MVWMGNLRRFMMYKRIPDLSFDWSYEELMNLPLFMIHHIYETLDEFIEEMKQRANSIPGV
jgi:hypothetical protein